MSGEETRKVKVPNPVRNFKLQQFVLSASRVFIIPLVGIFVIPGEEMGKGRKDTRRLKRVQQLPLFSKGQTARNKMSISPNLDIEKKKKNFFREFLNIFQNITLQRHTKISHYILAEGKLISMFFQ